MLKTEARDFPGSPLLASMLLVQGMQVQSLLRELGSYMPRGVAKKLKKKIK